MIPALTTLHTNPSSCHFVPKDSSTSVQHFHFFHTCVHHSLALCFILCNARDEIEVLYSNYLQVPLVCISGEDHFNSGYLTSKLNLLLLSRTANALVLLHVNLEKSESY